MGVHKNWLKSIVNRNNKSDTDPAISIKKHNKWSIWKPCHVIGKGAVAEENENDPVDIIVDETVNWPIIPSDPREVSQAELEEWAAIRIQTAFRVFLAKRALSALRGLARLQTAVNGNNGNKHSNGNLRSIQAFVRMQAKIHALRAAKTKEGQVQPQRAVGHTNECRPAEAEGGWCDSIGSVEEIQARLQQRQEAAIKRERAMAYAFSNQWRANSKLKIESFFDYELDNSAWSWIWLDRWINSQQQQQAGTPGSMSPLIKLNAHPMEDMAKTSKQTNQSKNPTKPNLSNDASKGASLIRARSVGSLPAIQTSNQDNLNTRMKPNGQQLSRSVQHEWTPAKKPNKDVKRNQPPTYYVARSKPGSKHQSEVHPETPLSTPN